MPTDWGSEVEDAARHLAGNLGVPDFVYEPANVAKGQASREVSDGLLACGNDGLILQVKTRDASAGTADDPAKSERWIRKEAQRARAQADGTRRTLGDGDIKLTSLRGYERTFTDIPSWPAVVILAHPALPAGIVLDDVADTMWITLRDWLALHERLRSTAAVIRYVHRALASPLHPPLGAEEDRYNALAAADLAAEGGPDSVPALPTSTPTGRSAFDASFIADLIQKVWPRDGHFPWEHPDEYRRIVEALDRIPPAIRVGLGRKMQSTFGEMLAAWGRRSFFYWDESQDGLFTFVYDVADEWPDPDEFLHHVAAVAAVRFTQFLEGDVLAPEFVLGVGVLHYGEEEGRRYSFALFEPPPPDVQEIRWMIESTYGAISESGVPVLPPTPGRNAPCPCRSGRKFKHCCGRAA